MTAPLPHTGYLARDRDRHPPALTPGYKTSVTRAPLMPLVASPASLSETTGPAFGHVRLGPLDNDLILNFARPGEMALGPRIVVRGRVMDQYARPLPDTLVEVWQANAGGRYRHRSEAYLAPLDPNFGGCGRVLTDAEGGYEFRTVLPGPYPWPNGMADWRPAHIHLSLFGRAFSQRLITQMYFEGDPMIRHCKIANTVPDPAALASLVATLDMAQTVPMDARVYVFDIVLRGRRQTMFENRWEGM